MGVSILSPRFQHSADYYRSKRQELQRHGAVKKRHAGTTKLNMHIVKEKWTRYKPILNSSFPSMLTLHSHCKHLSVQPHQHLIESTKEDIMTFLEWMLDTYRRVRKRSTVHSYKRILFQVYRKSVGADFEKLANEEINDVSIPNQVLQRLVECQIEIM